MVLKINNNKIEIANPWYAYLYPYLIRFCLKEEIGIDWKNDIITVPIEKRERLQLLLCSIMRELLNDCYIEPTQKQRNKFPTRYQKIYFEDNLYVLNYRTDIIGIVAYGISYLLSEIEKIS